MQKLINNEGVLYVNENAFTGPIPLSIGKASSLTYVDISDNEITGFIPDSFYDLDKLEFAYLSNNTLAGTISEKISEMSSLRDFWVEGNVMTGTIPNIQPGELGSLAELLLHRNSFIGKMPESICELDLEKLFADCEELSCSCCTSCYRDSV